VKRLVIIWSIWVGSLVLVGCHTPPPTPTHQIPNQPPPIPDTIWQLDHILEDQVQKAQVIAQQVQFVSNTEFIGFDGCNSFQGRFRYVTEDNLPDGLLQIGRVNQTVLDCATTIETTRVDEILESQTIEEWGFLDLLLSASRYEMADEELKLHLDDGSKILVFHPATRPLRYQVVPPP